MLLKNPVTPRGIDPGTVRLVAQRLNHYATPRRQIMSNINTMYSHVSRLSEIEKQLLPYSEFVSFSFVNTEEVWLLRSLILIIEYNSV